PNGSDSGAERERQRSRTGATAEPNGSDSGADRREAQRERPIKRSGSGADRTEAQRERPIKTSGSEPTALLLLLAQEVDGDFGGGSVRGAGFLADLADALPGDAFGLPAPLERRVGHVGEAVLQPEVVELARTPH